MALKKGPPPGENHPSSKLTEDQVYQIRASVEPQKELAKRFGVSPSTISRICTGKTWTHLSLHNNSAPRSKLSAEDIPEICDRIHRGATAKQVAKDLGVSPTAVLKVWHGITWTHIPRPPKPSSSWKKVWEK